MNPLLRLSLKAFLAAINKSLIKIALTKEKVANYYKIVVWKKIKNKTIQIRIRGSPWAILYILKKHKKTISNLCFLKI